MADIKLSAPVLNHNGLGFESNFELFRQDSIVNRQRFDLKISTSPGGKWRYQLGFVTTNSSGLSTLITNQKVKVSTNSISLSVSLLPFQNQGIELNKRALQFEFFPTLKKISDNEGIVSLPQVGYDFNFRYPIKLKSERFNIQTFSRIAGILSNQITLQDQLRTGGNRTIRGFNENAFFGSQICSFTLQPQYLVDKSFLVGVFSDLLLINSNLNNQFFKKPSTAFGFGIAIELDFGSNSVQLSLANGVTSGIPLDFQATKIHFGYVARF